MEDFDLRISDHDGYIMRVSVVQSKAGNVAPVEVEAPHHGAQYLANEHDAGLRDIAAEFTAQVLPAAVWQAWRESWASAGENGIRLRIRCEDSDSARIPWELLYDAERRYFLAQDPRSPVVRYLEGPIPESVRPIEGPLRILLTGASPADQDKLDVAKELDGIESALAKEQQAGRVAITRVDDLTLDTLDRTLLEVKPHVFHFSGHGVWDEAEHRGYLMLESGAGETAVLADNMLAMLLRNRGVVLVVLNACETALGGDAWSGLAQSLVLARVPAVVAMQMPVTDAAAVAFAGTLYAGLANEYSLEQAVTLARQTAARLPEDVASPSEWLAPALFMRTGSEQFWLHEQKETEEAPARGTFINNVDAVNVAETQFVDQRGAEITVGDRMVHTGGGAYVRGDVKTSGDFVGRDRIEHGISRSAPDANKTFTKLAASVALQASTANVEKAAELLGDMQQAFTQGNDDKLADCIGDLADLVPNVKDTIIQAFSQPPLSERVGPAAKYALRRLD